MTDSQPTTFSLKPDSDASSVRVYRCLKAWDALQVTDQKEVRYCDSCKKSVYQIIDMEGYEQTVAKSRCVMVEGYDIKTKKQHVLLGNVEVARYNTGQGLDWS